LTTDRRVWAFPAQKQAVFASFQDFSRLFGLLESFQHATEWLQQAVESFQQPMELLRQTVESLQQAMELFQQIMELLQQAKK
jgi:exonuclease VII small subunit